ncbi:MAG: ATP-binding cassette domain-containing protein [Oscillospiraceae bacterium]|jgi:putative ABC transport system ATP-binding protein|nr:ATP-binding cassette domain-containing protein [Oscillospiraceae bacterium]
MSAEQKNQTGGSLLELRHIDKTFNSGSVSELSLFKDFNLSVARGRFVCIIGSNGSGKTTLLNLLCGGETPDAGQILLGGRDITKEPEHVRSRRIGRVFQNPAFGTCPQLTILENLSLADRKGKSYGLSRGVSGKKLDEYRSKLELLKLGLENHLDLPVANLSGGQRQALALLICTMTPIDLLILDEHTAALDPSSSENVMELTRSFVQEKHLTALMVTHNLRFALAYGDRLLMMHRGKTVLDVCDGEKEALHVRDLTERFNEISIEDGNDV